MFCISLGTNDFELAKKHIQNAQMAEVRLDLTRFNKDQIAGLCKMNGSLIFTYRKNTSFTDEARIDALKTAIELQAGWIDLDIEEGSVFLDRIFAKIRGSKHTKLILSYHNFEHCPTNEKLYDVILSAAKYSPDLIKIACMSHGIRDNKRILRFNTDFSNVLAFCMGSEGKSTRALSLLIGAPFSYVALPDQQTAPGQMTIEEMEIMLNEFRQKSGISNK
ncbi:MAG TPA: type I 3-dehydroquinate dehydratase [Saprospiraceae bacterium]|nr:type I 3-dehydroquinate dehydratase [Saprospiraceae bacterium]